MKLTEEEAKAKLEQVGLPIHGTHDELIARLEANGLVEKEARVEDGVRPFKVLSEYVDKDADARQDVVAQQPKRGRPKVK